jgi:hypothetical protein
MAASLDGTERGVFGIITDLVESGYVAKEKDARRNRYQSPPLGNVPSPKYWPPLTGADATAAETCQSLVILAKGERIRTLREPKSTITASSSSTRTTQPRPYLSWVTRSRTVNCSTGGSTGGAVKGLPGRKRRDAARAGFINASMRPCGHGDPIPGGFSAIVVVRSRARP